MRALQGCIAYFVNNLVHNKCKHWKNVVKPTVKMVTLDEALNKQELYGNK